ncbi:MAG: ribonucleotide-diphosphate reductase subunit beta [Candidatus Thermoplasmatota archaeon]|nr:ribonucleotide-diphosphate reductase subunit beta [Candidatus Thermoplasmatota archaeon]MCL5731103.1 ribonucleotide-diphosphate reductase subunit beta [Candidatus Thermoplasmatota archaeon]
MMETKVGLLPKDRMQRIFLFNENGDKWLSRRKVIGGSTTNLVAFESPKYVWAYNSYRKMVSYTFSPSEFNLDRENRDFAALSDLERKIFTRNLSSLIVLESMLLADYEVISPYFTAPEISAVMSSAVFHEILHSDTYTQIVTHAIPESLRESVYEMWRTTEWFKSRNRKINDAFYRFIKDPSAGNFLLNIIVSSLVVGAVLPTEFAVAFSFSRHNRLIFSTNALKFVYRDLQEQYSFFIKLILEIISENPHLADGLEREASDIMKDIIGEETDFIHNVSEGMAPGLTDFTLTRFCQSLANRLGKSLGFQTLYPGISGSPIPWFDSLAEIKK